MESSFFAFPAGEHSRWSWRSAVGNPPPPFTTASTFRGAKPVLAAGLTPTATNDPAAITTPARTPTSFLMARTLHGRPRGERYRSRPQLEPFPMGRDRDAAQRPAARPGARGAARPAGVAGSAGEPDHDLDLDRCERGDSGHAKELRLVGEAGRLRSCGELPLRDCRDTRPAADHQPSSPTMVRLHPDVMKLCTRSQSRPSRPGCTRSRTRSRSRGAPRRQGRPDRLRFSRDRRSAFRCGTRSCARCPQIATPGVRPGGFARRFETTRRSCASLYATSCVLARAYRGHAGCWRRMRGAPRAHDTPPDLRFCRWAILVSNQ